MNKKKIVEDRLKMLSALEPGWLGRNMYGDPPTAGALNQAREVLHALIDVRPTIRLPGIYPTPTGDIQAEWDIAAWSIEILFFADGKRVQAEVSNSEWVYDDNDEEHKDPSRMFEGAESGEIAKNMAEWLQSFMVNYSDTQTVSIDVLTEPDAKPHHRGGLPHTWERWLLDAHEDIEKMVNQLREEKTELLEFADFLLKLIEESETACSSSSCQLPPCVKFREVVKRITEIKEKTGASLPTPS